MGEVYRARHEADPRRRARARLVGTVRDESGAERSPSCRRQGMNTGIGDAVNLAWKLASVLHRQADERILDTSENSRWSHAATKSATSLTRNRTNPRALP